MLYKKEAPRVEALLKRRGWDAAAIHGDISQAQRTAAVEAFKAGTCPLLIATGVNMPRADRTQPHSLSLSPLSLCPSLPA